MNIPEALALGAIQGLTEFLPVSSSGHLEIFKSLFGVSVNLIFDVLLHVATLVVTLIVFRKKVGSILAALFDWVRLRGKVSDEQAVEVRNAGIILLATALTAGLGFALKGAVEDIGPKAISALLVATGLLLVATRFFRQGGVDFTGLSWKHGVIVGIAQGVGVIPGISRSGISISAGLAGGLDRQTAGEFSFLLSLPAIVGALILNIGDIDGLAGDIGVAPLLLGMLAAGLVGFASLKLLLRFVRSGQLWVFAFYLVPAGIAGFIYF